MEICHKNRFFFSSKMDGEHFMENPMNKWMIWGGFIYPLFLVQHPHRNLRRIWVTSPIIVHRPECLSAIFAESRFPR